MRKYVCERESDQQRVIEAAEKEGRGGRQTDNQIDRERSTDRANDRARNKMILYYTRIKI